MAHIEGMDDVPVDDGSAQQGSSVCMRSRPCSSERDGQVRAVKAALQSRLGPYEPVLTYLQSVLVWERPVQCVLLYTVVNVVFWFFALTSLRLLFLLAAGLAVIVSVDTWRNKIWPEIRVRNLDESENESWGLVQPGILSVPELCHHISEAWVSGAVLASSAVQFKRLNPGKFDDAIVAKELALTDSEHSDAEVSYTDNGTFNLSRGQTPLTEGSEDFDRHSDAEESFAQDLPDFPSINPDATLMDDDDDTSMDLPSLALSALVSHRASMLDVDSHLDSDQEDLDEELSLSGLPPASDFAGDLAGVIASNMIQAALAGALQPRPSATRRREGPPRAGTHRSYRKQSSSELDTDLDGEDFEMLDQSELNQMDPLGGGGGSRRGESQGSNFLSSFLGKPQ
ncbi:reticulophagy regulator 3 isoform X2 [Cottoperca gobio]|uniref:Reticulophagy regulator 3 isoform X2 n=1 Tax=Cottoperca gobio TaxID=56716 RepID=A0A6J2Q3M2_COTGO|nr:reticulophagy regulator 3 isoform X2 [Cottoperca gobio]